LPYSLIPCKPRTATRQLTRARRTAPRPTGAALLAGFLRRHPGTRPPRLTAIFMTNEAGSRPAGTCLALPKGTPCFTAPALGEIARQIADRATESARPGGGWC